MSKTVTHVDMDDVLSSIKRLVTVKETAPTTEQSPEEGVLLLTPAFRVPEKSDVSGLDLGQEPKDIAALVSDVQERSQHDEHVAELEQIAPVRANEAVEDTAASQTPKPEKTTLEARIAELEQAVGRTDDQWEPDGSEPQELHHPKLHFLERYREKYGESGPMPGEDQADLHASSQAEAPEDKDIAEPAAPETERPTTVPVFSRSNEKAEGADVIDLADVTANSTPPASTPSNNHIEISEFVETHTDAAQSGSDAVEPLNPSKLGVPDIDLSGADDEDAGQSHAPEAIIPEPLPEELAAEQTAAEGPLQLEDVAVFVHRPAQPAADHAAQSDANQALENTQVPTDQPTPSSDAIRDLAAEATPRLDVRDASEVVGAEDEFLVDEAVLRQVVSDIVRDELQGRLGERITRNVRRMVRQEIEKTISRKLLD